MASLSRLRKQLPSLMARRKSNMPALKSSVQKRLMSLSPVSLAQVSHMARDDIIETAYKSSQKEMLIF